MDPNEILDLVWEVGGIGKVIRRTPRQTINLLQQGMLPARKIGNRWCASRAALVEFFTTATLKKAA